MSDRITEIDFKQDLRFNLRSNFSTRGCSNVFVLKYFLWMLLKQDLRGSIEYFFVTFYIFHCTFYLFLFMWCIYETDKGVSFFPYILAIISRIFFLTSSLCTKWAHLIGQFWRQLWLHHCIWFKWLIQWFTMTMVHFKQEETEL